MKKFLLIFVSLLFSIAAQSQTCFTPPPDSPVLAPTLDTIPPVTDTILTNAGTRVEAQANGHIAFIQKNENDQRVWFSTDSTPGFGKSYYNRRYRADASSPWYWQYSHSIKIFDLGQTSAGPSTVLYSATPKYRDPLDVTGAHYNYVMYAISQPGACNGGVLGYMYVTYSNDGICWTALRRVTVTGGPAAICGPDAGKTKMVPAEVVTAIDSGDTIQILLMEGTNAKLVPHTAMSQTFAHIGHTSPEAPDQLIWYGGATTEIVGFGVLSPYGVAGNVRYQTYSYFMNLDMAYDPTSGYLYVTRAYPYAFDRNSDISAANVPCHWQGDVVNVWDPVLGGYAGVGGCNMAPSTLPNRIQIYRMYLGSIAQFPEIAYPSGNYVWELLADWGGDVGYTNAALSCAYTARSDTHQQNVGRDYAYVNFLRDATGNLMLYDGVPMALAGDSVKLSKGYGPCYVTGNEKLTLVSFPR
jgi:hypothetical protein